METWEFLEVIKHLKEIALGEATINSKDVTIRNGREFAIEYYQGKLIIDIANDLKNLVELIRTINESISLVEVATKVTSVDRIVMKPNSFEIELKTVNSEADIEYTITETRVWPEIKINGTPDTIMGELLFLRPFIEYFNKMEGKIIETSAKALTGTREIINIPADKTISVRISRTHDKDISARIKIDNIEFSLSYPDYLWLDTSDLNPVETLILGLSDYCGDCSKEEFSETIDKLPSLVEKIMKIPNEYNVVLLSITGDEPQFILSRNTNDVYLMTTSTDVALSFTKNTNVQNVINIVSDAKNILENLGVVNKNLDKTIEILEEHKDSLTKGQIWFSPEIAWDELKLNYFSDYVYSKVFSESTGFTPKRSLTIPINGANTIPNEFVIALSLLKDLVFSITAKTNGTVRVSLDKLTAVLSINDETVNIELLKTKKGADKDLKVLKEVFRSKGYEVEVANPELLITPRLNVEIIGANDRAYTIEADEWNRDYGMKAVFKLPDGTRIIAETENIKTKELSLKIPVTSFVLIDTIVVNLRSGIFEYLRDDKVIRRGLIPFYMISEQ